ncbi:hypothetical protein KP803_15700 [Vibrio sp. ZSDE26]|uniref:DUF4157 domain-containing protein n=1 Tax=Vibrio amylolyticus TaxID=2847292 RepID=A0A9X2BIA4_9VIBR|nr:hypothetical protein [Vibrio amylolyticus]MCK6264724.1 hypothetical protein [Vibrio amylolyticus]
MKRLLKIVTLLLFAISILGCEDKNEVYANPPGHLLEQLEAYFPLSIKYVRKNEEIALTQGVPLLPQYIEIAHKIGIKHPEKIRVHYADSIPLPENESLLFQMQRLGLDSPYITGTTFGYGIWIANRAKGDKLLMSHELIHVKQVEDMGLEAFTKKYLLQLKIFGYAESPIELEAYKKAGKYL